MKDVRVATIQKNRSEELRISLTEFHGHDLGHDVPVDIKYGAALRAQQPFVPRSRKGVNAGLLDVDRERAHALDRVHHEEAGAATADLADGF